VATPRLRSASRHYRLSALIARRAVREAHKARSRGLVAVAGVVAAHQVANVREAESGFGSMLAEQDIDDVADALLNVLAFTTPPAQVARMVQQTTTDFEFDRLVDSIVQEAARAAEQAMVVARQDIYHVRYLSPPSCARCAILAGRVYRWSEGFLRHPGCDCVMIPTTVAAPYAQDPDELVREGLVTGLSKADRRALMEGADLGQVVNVRSKKAGLRGSGRVLERAGRPTPEGIYALASDRAEAVDLLKRFGYLK
jgi:hypothetical protein